MTTMIRIIWTPMAGETTRHEHCDEDENPSGDACPSPAGEQGEHQETPKDLSGRFPEQNQHTARKLPICIPPSIGTFRTMRGMLSPSTTGIQDDSGARECWRVSGTGNLSSSP